MPVFAQAGSPDATAGVAFDAIFESILDHSPQLVTSFGLDKGARASAKSRLDDNSLAGAAADLTRTKDAIAKLKAIDPAKLSPATALNLEIILYTLEQQTVAQERLGIGSAVRPYTIFQQGGAYFGMPDFLNTAHSIKTKDDCDAYLSRLSAFARALDNDTETQRVESTRGFIAPGWSLDLTLGQIANLRSPAAADNSLTRSLTTRAASAGVEGDWSAAAARIVEAEIYPALDRQIALLKSLQPKTAQGDGVWRLPKGDELYAVALEQMTTTTYPPAQVHQMGLDQVADLSAQLDEILKSQGMTKGSVGERLTALNASPKQLYPDTPAGREQLIADLNTSYNAMFAKLPKAFATIPDVPLEIRAVPVEIQDGASNGYYRRAPLDRSRPALYFINLKDVADWPKYTLPSLKIGRAHV